MFGGDLRAKPLVITVPAIEKHNNQVDGLAAARAWRLLKSARNRFDYRICMKGRRSWRPLSFSHHQKTAPAGEGAEAAGACASVLTIMPSWQELARPNNSAAQKPFPLQWPILDLRVA
jgi:hypothetical protein